MSDGCRLVVFYYLNLKEALGGDHQGVVDRLLIIRGPLEKDICELLWGNLVSADGIHAVSDILASDCANTSPVIVVSLGNIPVIRTEQVDMNGTHSILGDNSTLPVLRASNCKIRGSDLGSIGKLLEGAIIS